MPLRIKTLVTFLLRLMPSARLRVRGLDRDSPSVDIPEDVAIGTDEETLVRLFLMRSADMTRPQPWLLCPQQRKTRNAAQALILEYDHPNPLADLYQQRMAVPGLERIADFQDALNRPVILYEVVQ